MPSAGNHRTILFLAGSLLSLGIAALVSCQRQQPVGPVTPKPPRKIEPAPTLAEPEPAVPSPATDAKTESPSKPAPLFENWPKPALAFVFTGQQLGYIEPCGC